MTRRTRNLRRQSSTPNLKIPQAQMSMLQVPALNPASPPETPTESPHLSRNNNQSQFYLFANSLAQDPNIRPYGNGHQFSYRPLEQLSPRSSSSSSSSSEAEADSSDDGSSDSASIVSLPNSSSQRQQPPQHQQNLTSLEPSGTADTDADADSESVSDSGSEADSEAEPASDSESEAESEGRVEKPAPQNNMHANSTDAKDPCEFTIEDIDPMDSDCDDLDILLPTEVESNRSRSRSRHRDLDKNMMHDLKNLNCSNEASDNEPEVEADGEVEAFLKRRQELKRIRRVSMSSSFGKRTHSELSDSDDNDAALDVNEVGSSARRFRKRLHRGSLLFHDPPEPRIDELDEPDSSEEEYEKEMTALAQELPYWAMEIMEVDSS